MEQTLNTAPNLHEAWFWHEEDGKVRCRLCAHQCLINPERTGICRVRKNIEGKLYSLNYGRMIAAHLDPIEKKPLNHFLPGSQSFSIAMPGCNLGCAWCQNWQISQADEMGNLARIPEVSPLKIVQAAKEFNAASIAYTYTEPTVFYEFARETAFLAREADIKNLFVTNGLLTPEVNADLVNWLDAANVDLKAFDQEVYRKYMHGDLEPVLATCKALKAAGVWLEVTTLLIPGVNDDPLQVQGMAKFIADELGTDTPWHISRYFPQYKFDAPPTPVSGLDKAEHMARLAGLKYVYPGNTASSTQTMCQNCGKLLVDRDAFRMVLNVIEDGKCPRCGTAVAGVWA